MRGSDVRLGARTTLLAGLLLLACAGPRGSPPTEPLDPIAAGYVRLVLAIGQHSPDYVDSYFGPPAWNEEARRAGKRPLSDLAGEAARLLGEAERVAVKPGDGERALRRAFLVGQLASARTYLARLGGERLSFDEEARGLYGVVPPRRDLARFEAVHEEIERLLPGEGAVAPRLDAWKRRTSIPREKIAAVMRAAIDEARRRTLLHAALPAGESFTLSLVTDKPWRAYNWYEGGGRSRIEVNADLPVYISLAIPYAAHEGYPGHHFFNAVLEQRLVRERGQVEHTVSPLFSPISLVEEGSAEAGLEMAFPDAERLAFERDVLFPLAGLDPADAPRAARIRKLRKSLGPATVELARRYVDGAMTGAEVEAWLVAFALSTRDEAAHARRGFDVYRSYIANYSFGEELVKGWLEARAGGDAARRWAAFVDLVGSPRLPAALLER